MDGKFEIVVIEKINSSSLLKAGLAKFDDEFYDSQYSMVISTTEAEIHFEQARLLQLDGEVIGKFKELKIRILPGAVKLITNNDNKFLQ